MPKMNERLVAKLAFFHRLAVGISGFFTDFLVESFA